MQAFIGVYLISVVLMSVLPFLQVETLMDGDTIPESEKIPRNIWIGITLFPVLNAALAVIYFITTLGGWIMWFINKVIPK